MTEAKQQLLVSCLVVVESAFIHRHRSDPVIQLEQLDETFQCAFAAVAGFLLSLQSQMVRFCCILLTFPSHTLRVKKMENFPLCHCPYLRQIFTNLQLVFAYGFMLTVVIFAYSYFTS